ncbi:hypothetical protein TWF281_009001 [Arthrobotrys megalospora]
MSEEASINSIPPELFLSINSYLPLEDIGNLSLVSKFFRLITLPYLFRRTRLCPESIVAFRGGGRLSEVAGRVQQLTLDTANSGVRGPNDICTFTRACISVFDLDTVFPNVTRFKIVFAPEMSTPSGTFHMDQRILRSTLMGLSKFSFYKKLKALSFMVDMPGEGGINPTIPFDDEVYYQLSNENWEFIGLAVEYDGYSDEAPDPWADSEGVFPTSLKELSLVTPPGVRYNIHIDDSIGPGLFSAAKSVAASLDKVEILAVPPIFRSDSLLPLFPDIVYSRVKEFSLGLDTERYFIHLQEAVRKFPNVERLELTFPTSVGFHISVRRQRLSRIFPELAKLKELRKVVIEAPMKDETNNPNAPRRGPRNVSRPANHMSIAAMIEAVSFWLAAGLDKLESVEFRLYFISKDKLDDILEMLELYCEVVREGLLWKLEWRSVRTNYENGRVDENSFSSLPTFNVEQYLVAAGL